MLQEPYYAHKELMAELGLTTKKLPSELKANVITFNQKKRFAKNPDLIIELQNFSELIAGEIQAWHMANDEPEAVVEEKEIAEEEEVEEEEVEEEEVEEEEAYEQDKVELQQTSDDIEVDNALIRQNEEFEIVGETQDGDPIVDETPKEEKSNGGWGINTSW